MPRLKDSKQKRCKRCGRSTSSKSSLSDFSILKKTRVKCSKVLGRLPGDGLVPIAAVYFGYRDLTAYGSFAATLQKAIDFGYNLLVLAFWISPVTGVDPYSAADLWTKLSAADRNATLAYAHANNAKIILATGGATFAGYQVSGPLSGSSFGTDAANFAKSYNFDGLDFDLENFVSPGFTTSTGLTKEQTIQWMTDATAAARSVLGEDALITHAPQSPYFSTPEFSQGYLDFYLQTPTPSVDLFLVQYYNQGATYLTYPSQMINNDNFHPGTAVAQLIQRGIPKEKVVVGKLTQPTDGGANSWVSPQAIHEWVVQAATDSAVYNWHTGVSTWQWNTSGDPTSQYFIATIYPPGGA